MSSDSTIKVVINVPSIRPDSYANMLASSHHLTWSNHQIVFDLVAQQPWVSFAAYKSSVSFTMMPRLKVPSMLNLRLQTIVKYRFDSDYIMFIDDDLVYNKGTTEYFTRVFDYLAEHRPAVMSIFGGRYAKEFVENPYNCIITTNRGLLVRSDLLYGFSPSRLLLGGCEESVIVYHALSQLREHVVIGGAPVSRHLVKHLEIGSNSPIHDQMIYEQNVRTYIRTKYNDASWDALTGDFPKGLTCKL